MRPLTDREFSQLTGAWDEIVDLAPPGWPQRFAWSIREQMLDPGWRPSPRQLNTMRVLFDRFAEGRL